MAGTPSLDTVLGALLTDLVVEKVIMASGNQADQPLPLTRRWWISWRRTAAAQGKPITIEYCLHEAFKARTRQSKAVCAQRRGDPYANLILCAGVAF